MANKVAKRIIKDSSVKIPMYLIIVEHFTYNMKDHYRYFITFICYNSKMIDYDDFAKLDIRIGTIISAEKIPEGDKLLKLQVDMGDDPSADSGRETKQIMSGIAEFYTDPESLVGKQIPILMNLKPRMLRGYESQGMMLAADTEGKPILLHPESKIPNGSKIK